MKKNVSIATASTLALSDLMTINTLIQHLTSNRRRALLVAVVAAFVALLVTLSLDERYESSYQVSSASDMVEATRNMASQGFLLGANPFAAGSDATGDFAQYLMLLTSYDIGLELLEHPDLVQGMFPSVVHGRFATAPAWVRAVLAPIANVFLGQPDTTITADNVSSWLNKNITRNSSLRTPIWTISVATADADFGRKLLGFVHESADRIIRERSRTNVEERSEFLLARLEATAEPAYRAELISLLYEQERLQMLLSSHTPYASTIVESVHSSTKPVWPPRLLLLIVLSAAFFVTLFIIDAVRAARRA